MPSVHPRINTVLEPPLFEAVKKLARRDGVSLSQKVRELVREALELREDAALEELVDRRRTNPAPSIPHEELKRRLGIR
ncbi:MAG: ribbon-helix-helix protein, CopG family [Armatimonadota bacterium]|nr:ribbon-helix-helix protein, CopG family [Armatimonadota bacterium]